MILNAFQEKSGSSSTRGVASSPTATSAAILSSSHPNPRSPSTTASTTADDDDPGVRSRSCSRFSWRSKTWQSDSPSKSEKGVGHEASAQSSSPSPTYQSSRKHSLTVPGESSYIRAQSLSHLMGHQQKHSTSASEPTSLGSKKLQRSRSPSPLSTPSGSASL